MDSQFKKQLNEILMHYLFYKKSLYQNLLQNYRTVL